MEIIIATKQHQAWLSQHDSHISSQVLLQKIAAEQIYLLQQDATPIGWLRYGLFWDNTPFLNMLYLLEPYRSKGSGRQLMLFWEDKMKASGYATVMTSTLSDESAQHFYRRLGYQDAGCLLLPGEAAELLFIKQL